MYSSIYTCARSNTHARTNACTCAHPNTILQLRDVRAASKVNLEMLKHDLMSLHVGVRESLAYVSSLEFATGAGGDRGGGDTEVLRRFLESAAKELEEVLMRAFECAFVCP
jgi:hypothetical protein